MTALKLGQLPRLGTPCTSLMEKVMACCHSPSPLEVDFSSVFLVELAGCLFPNLLSVNVNWLSWGRLSSRSLLPFFEIHSGATM